MKTIIGFFLLTLILKTNIAQDMKSIHSLKARTIDGTEIEFSQFKGKKLLIVNTASKCGFTPQYTKLQALYENYKDNNFVIIGFPANNFLNQEPGENNEIKAFCSLNYGVSFPMMEKISVKGKDIHPVYEWLTKQSLNGVDDAGVSWNFQKFLIDENGAWVGYLQPKDSPDDPRLIQWIETGNFDEK